jgi:DNA replication protein DnaC
MKTGSRGYSVYQVGIVKITLTGPQGSGKSILAQAIRKAARKYGLRIRTKEVLST